METKNMLDHNTLEYTTSFKGYILVIVAAVEYQMEYLIVL